jgi:putative membrane protein
MKPRIHLLGTMAMAAALSFGLSGCSNERRASMNENDMDNSADRAMTDDARQHDAQNSTGAAAGPVTTSGEEERSGVGRADRAANVSAADRQWVTKTAEGGMAEVALGRLAKEKASSDSVKEFGSRMVDDHSKANDELKKIASEKGIDLPADTDAKHKAEMRKLEKLSGAQFDRAYMQAMTKDHDHDIAHFEQGSRQLQDEDLKKFASNTLPTLREHRNMAQSAMNNLRSAKSSGNADRSK